MQLPRLALLALLGSSMTLALPQPLHNLLSPRQSCADTCGSVCYTSSDVTDALNEGYSDYQAGDTVGSDSYPHTYRDDEGFDFSPVTGPYYEFPILSSGQVYTGGSPGADRVVFNGDGELAGLITHTGASTYDGFVQCTNSSSSDGYGYD